ncbi:MAG: 2-hydroxyglutaryl-CoA dehydratase [Polyangiaceae bacterium]|jgi:predicted nucleotide-binding protein (sugar kinase/HSP70/actin superfamily)
MSMNASVVGLNKKSLPLVDMEAELKRFEEEERKRLGLDAKTEHWIEDMAGLTFTKREKAKITMLVGGLTMAHDYFVEAGLRGAGYNVQMLECPTNEGLQVGKEFGNRGQCNPTYFTVGNLVKYLITLRDKHGMTAKEVVDKYVFLTAGACGPCRFGMYVTEYRKALRDAGFDGFKVVLFQQTGGLKQATGEESGLELNPAFFWAIVKAIVAGDVLNALGYRIRPFEVTAGDTDRAIDQCKEILYKALENRTNILLALWQCKPLLAQVQVDRTLAKPKVSIIGEFWAMTTEGDGNYQLQRFLESEGAEADVQLVTAWLLYTVWEGKHDTRDRADLRAGDAAKYGLGGIADDPFGVAKKLAALTGAGFAIRALFQTFAYTAGLYGYKLPNMDDIAKISHDYYNNDLRGGEGHMEVGKLIMNTIHSKSHMTLSVKPFGCMPSAGVSDGVQSAIAERYPGSIFCPVETSGDGRVNFYSRVQMYLFKAKQVAIAEYDRALQTHGLTREQVKTFLEASPRFASPLYRAPHAYAGSAADLVAAIAPYITKTRAQRWKERLSGMGTQSAKLAHQCPHLVVKVVKGAVEAAPDVVQRAKFDAKLLAEARKASKAKTRKGPVADLSAAAE